MTGPSAPGRPELVLLVGIPGSGKSTFFRARLAATHLHLSKDAWPNARKKEERLRRLLGEALARGQSVAVDNTQPAVRDRAALIAIGRAHGARIVAYFFNVRLALALARNALREGRARVDEAALAISAQRLEPPTRAEGIDALFEVDAEGAVRPGLG